VSPADSPAPPMVIAAVEETNLSFKSSAAIPASEPVDLEPAPAMSAPAESEENVHQQRLRQGFEEQAGHRQARLRDPAWQHDQRQLEQRIRADAATIAGYWHNEGLSALEVANLLDIPPRTLRHWRHELDIGRLQGKALGRPHARCTPEQGQTVIRFLHQHGPWVGVPTLTGAFAAAPRAELRDLLRVFRHLWASQHPREIQVLHWHQVGTVWAMDFTKVMQPIDERFPYIFAVRDLASGFQLAWQPVLDMTTATAQAELELLFTVYGAPLVLKSDNGSAFRADGLKAFLRRWQVWPLYSPPGQPGYNGAIEASIGSLKTRTKYQAYRNGHLGAWTSADLDSARASANAVARPRGGRGPTPAQAWEPRRPPTWAERAALAVLVHHGEAEIRGQQGIAVEASLDHYTQAALHRRVLTQVLVERSYLSITRRRIPQQFFGQKTANIW
jgi:transposase InsO family protein